MIQTQTFDLPVNAADELAVLSRALELLGGKKYSEAIFLLISRCDQLMTEPILKIYDQRETA